MEDCDTGRASSIAIQIECLFTIIIPIPICELCLKNDVRGWGWGGGGGRQKALSNEGNEGEVAYTEKNKEKFMNQIKFHHYVDKE